MATAKMPSLSVSSRAFEYMMRGIRVGRLENERLRGLQSKLIAGGDPQRGRSARAGDMHLAGASLDHRAKVRRDRFVGEQMGQLAEMAAAHRRGAAEFAVIGDQQGCAAVRCDSLPGFDLAGIEVQQAAVGIDAADTENAEVGLEFRKERDGGIADDVAVPRPQRAARKGDVDIGIARERGRHAQAVGDNVQV